MEMKNNIEVVSNTKFGRSHNGSDFLVITLFVLYSHAALDFSQFSRFMYHTVTKKVGCTPMQVIPF